MCAYLICSTPRTGSTMLCDLLAETNVAGNPNSFFMDQFYLDWASYWRVSTDSWSDHKTFDQNYINAAIQEGRGNTNIFGQRVQWKSLADLLERLRELNPDIEQDKDLLSRTFGIEYYIHLSRANKVAQAVSLTKAEQSGLWHLYADGTERERLKNGKSPEYNFSMIKKYYSEIKAHDSAWKAWFQKQKIEPISITYEALCLGPQETLSNILESMRINAPTLRLTLPKTMRMSDKVSDEWVRRFLSESNTASALS